MQPFITAERVPARITWYGEEGKLTEVISNNRGPLLQKCFISQIERISTLDIAIHVHVL